MAVKIELPITDQIEPCGWLQHAVFIGRHMMIIGINKSVCVNNNFFMSLTKEFPHYGQDTHGRKRKKTKAEQPSTRLACSPSLPSNKLELVHS